jgi:signal transduction histidine kinase
MLPRGSPALTHIGFRRDVRLFFGSLVGFLSVLIIMLLLLLQNFLEHTQAATERNWSDIVQMTIDDMQRFDLLSDPASLEARLSMLEGRYGIAGITVTRRGQVIRVGVPATQQGVERIVRSFQGATITFAFDSSELTTVTRTFWATAIICLAGTAAATMLVIFYLPSITKPIESMLDAAAQLEERDPAHDEQQYLIDTFRKSVVTLRAQEAELQRMHDLQKERADDLERVTAALTRSLASGFMAIDPQGRVVEINSAGREILRPAGNAAGVPVEEAFGQSPFTDAVRSAVEQKIGLTRLELQVKDQIIGLTTVPLLGEQQQFLGVLALFTDLTHIRDLETRVRELQTLADLGEISAGIAHEFRNSLATILGYLRLVGLEPLADKPRSSLERAEIEATQLSAAVDSLLSFARPMRLNKTDVDLFDLVSGVAEKIEKPAGVNVTCDGSPVNITADSALLSRAFENLIRNAIDSVAEKGGGSVRITVTASPTPTVRVEDDGVGIDPADVPRLMLPFQSDRAKGYGLGLPLSRKIALLHGASFELTGTPGAGASATIRFFAGDSATALQFVTTEAY